MVENTNNTDEETKTIEEQAAATVTRWVEVGESVVMIDGGWDIDHDAVNDLDDNARRRLRANAIACELATTDVVDFHAYSAVVRAIQDLISQAWNEEERQQNEVESRTAGKEAVRPTIIKQTPPMKATRRTQSKMDYQRDGPASENHLIEVWPCVRSCFLR